MEGKSRVRVCEGLDRTKHAFAPFDLICIFHCCSHDVLYSGCHPLPEGILWRVFPSLPLATC